VRPGELLDGPGHPGGRGAGGGLVGGDGDAQAVVGAGGGPGRQPSEGSPSARVVPARRATSSWSAGWPAAERASAPQNAPQSWSFWGSSLS
jgi:hypothetical protein